MNSASVRYLASVMVLLMACDSDDGTSTAKTAGGGGSTSTGAGGGQGQEDKTKPTTAGGGNLGPDGQGGHAGHGGQIAVLAGGGGASGSGDQQAAPHRDAAAGPGGAAGAAGSTSQSSASGGAAGDSPNLEGGADATSPATSDADAIGHPRRVLLSDEGNRRVLLVDLTASAGSVWSTPFNDSAKYGDSMRDLQLIGSDRVAASTAKGYVELDLKTGEVKKVVSSFSGVESMRRLPNGHTVLGANAEGGVTLQELDSQDAPVEGHKVTFTNYGQLRLVRRTPEGTFLMAVGTKLVEVTWDKQSVWEMAIPDGDWVFQGLRLPDRTIAVTSGYGAALLVIDPAGKKVVTTMGGKRQPDAATVVPNFYAGFQVLPNGHFVVTNWEGHGAGHGGTGVQLMEYDAAGALVWTWKQDPKLVSSLHGVIVLDGLDTAKLYDDMNGVLAPVMP